MPQPMPDERAASPPHDWNLPALAGYPNRTKFLTLGGVLVGLLMAALDQTIVSTALPRVVADLGGFDRFAWVFTAYLLASTSLIPVMGKLSTKVKQRTLLTRLVRFQQLEDKGLKSQSVFP